MKLLLCRGSPRLDIKKVNDYNEKLPVDRCIAQYTPEFIAYKKMREFFLSGDWDYMVLATDDIVVKPEHIEQLQKDIEENPYPVISGLMNVDEKDYFKKNQQGERNGNVNICQSLALKDKKLRYFDWYRYDNLPEENIFKVKFAGFGLTAIRRDIIEKYEFAGDAIFKGKGMQFGASLDFVFCWWCHENNIDVWVDKRIQMEHLRTSGEFHIGEFSKKLIFWPKNGVPQKINTPIEEIMKVWYPKTN